MRSAPGRALAGRATTNGSDARDAAIAMELRQTTTTDGRRVTEVVGDIVGNLNSLARAEARLAVAELMDGITERAKSAAGGAGAAAAGALLGVLALGGSLAAIAAALALVMPPWLAILVVALATGIAAWIMLSLGAAHLRRALKDPPKHDPASHDAKERR